MEYAEHIYLQLGRIKNFACAPDGKSRLWTVLREYLPRGMQIHAEKGKRLHMQYFFRSLTSPWIVHVSSENELICLCRCPRELVLVDFVGVQCVSHWVVWSYWMIHILCLWLRFLSFSLSLSLSLSKKKLKCTITKWFLFAFAWELYSFYEWNVRPTSVGFEFF